MMSASPGSSSKNQIKILLVDDVELFVALEKTFFQRDQFQIFTASNGADALALAQKEKPDLIFLDLYLAGMNGDEVCRRLKTARHTAQIPIVMVVQQGSRADLDCCRAACCDDILYKPVRQEDFMRASREQLSLTERLLPRIDACVLVKYGLRNDRLFEKYTVNIGVGGLFLASEAHLSIDTWLSLQIDLNDGAEPICCRGRVAWLNHPDWIKKPQLPHGMGVEFIDIDDEQLLRVSNYLARPNVT
ncbi:MAG: response regulator [Geopsychrobacter sp.]|nr:response regulator [Geopsychrobacter sp.]